MIKNTYSRVGIFFVAIVLTPLDRVIAATVINDGNTEEINSAFTDPSITVGSVTDGTLTIVNGGQVSSNHLAIGISGSTGIINVVEGGILNVTGAGAAYPFDIGGTVDGLASAGGTGILNVTGPGSIVNFNTLAGIFVEPVNIGTNGGNGVIAITNGGQFLKSAGTEGLWIGSNVDSASTATQSGLVTVDGTGSLLSIGGRVIVGTYSQGSLFVTNGGTAHTDTTFRVGNQAETGAFDNVLSIDGAGSLASAGTEVTIGVLGRGTAVVSNGGTLQSATGINIALSAGSTGELAIGAREGNTPSEVGEIISPTITFGAGNGKITLNHLNSSYSLNSNISGTGVINSINGSTALSGDNSVFNGNINISASSSIAVTEQRNLSNADIVDNGELRIQTSDDWVFTNAISGSGVLKVDADNHFFSFNSASSGNLFSGTVNLENTLFSLGDINTEALSQSTLLLGQGSDVTVATGTQSLYGIAFNGGTLSFGHVNPGDIAINEKVVSTGNLDLTGQGQIQIVSDGIVENNPRAPASSLTLLQQDDGNILLRLITGQGSVAGDAGNLSLLDQNGNAISDSVLTHIIQNGETVAEGTYDYRLTSGENQDGLYINYGLTNIELLTNGDNALALNAKGFTGSSADLSALVSGSGDLRIITDKDISLSNSLNNYTGTTWIDAGGLRMENNNVLGKTQSLMLASGTHLDMNGFSQTLPLLNTDVGSVLNFNNGSLTVNNGYIAGAMTGSGELRVSGGTVDILNNNTDMSVDTQIAPDSTVHMLANQALGTGSVNNKGKLYLGKNGDSSAPVELFSTRESAATYQIGALTNSGTIVIGHSNEDGVPVAGTTLLVNGNYAGEDGHLQFNTVLGNDNSESDHMIVAGDTSGITGVKVTNAGGQGASALNGIELITVGGKSGGEFRQEGRIVAGAYDYTLVRGDGDNQSNWYLVNNSTPPVTPPSTPPPTEPAPDTRPEGGSYIANLAAANTLFNTRLHDRLGETQYIDALTGEERVTSLWLRQTGAHNRWHDGSGQLKTQSNSYVAQLGGDIAQWSSDKLDRWHLGLMAGYAKSQSNTRSSTTGYSSKGSISGYSLGTYGTWFANDENKSGLYIDSWVQYSWFDNNVNGEQLAGESYKSKGLTASIETGYTIEMGKFTGSKGTSNQWFIQPQAQAIWMGVKADDLREINGTQIRGDGENNIQTRLGVRVFMKGHNAMDEETGREFEPYIETNWLHNTHNFGTTMDGVPLIQAGARNIGEIKIGGEGLLSKRVNLWGNIGVQLGDDGYSDTSAMVGFKYNF